MEIKNVMMIASFSAYFLTAPVSAADSQRLYPVGCHDQGFYFSNNQLTCELIDHGQTQTIYLVHNASLEDIIVETTPTPYMPSYKKTIPTNHWAAFARDEKKIIFSCKSAVHADTRYACQDVIQLCNYGNAKFPTQNMGTYWLQKTSIDQATMMQSVIKSGILLR